MHAEPARREVSFFFFFILHALCFGEASLDGRDNDS